MTTICAQSDGVYTSIRVKKRNTVYIIQGQVEIHLAVFDNDGGGNVISESSDLITTFVIRPNVVASTDGEYSDESRYISHYSALELAFRLTCLPPHSGENCLELDVDGSSSTFPHSKC